MAFGTSFQNFMNPNAVPDSQPVADTVSPLSTLQNAANAVYAPAELTPQIAQDLMWRSMTTGAPTSEFDKYGGYEAVSKLYNTGGGQYDTSTIPTENLNQYAQQVADTGVGNLSVLKDTNTPLTNQALANMQASGIDSSQFIQPYQAGILDQIYQNNLVSQTDPLKSTFESVYKDQQIDWKEAQQIQEYADKYNFKPEDIARVTGVPIDKVNQLLGAREQMLESAFQENKFQDPLALVRFMQANNLSAKQMAAASGGQLTEDQAKQFIDKASTTAGTLELADPKAYSQVKNIISRAVNKDYGGKEADWMYQMFAGLDPKVASKAPTQLEMTAPTTGNRLVGGDGDGGVAPTVEQYTIPGQVKPMQGLEVKTTDDEGNPTSYRVKLSDTFGGGDRPIYANYDTGGKLIGYDSNARIHVSDPQWYGASWDAAGKATPTSGVNRGGGWVQNTLQDLGPLPQIALAVATDGMSLEAQVASQAALQVASGVPLDKAVTNAAAMYAGAQVVNIPAIKEVVGGLDNAALQNIAKGAISGATTAGVLGKDIGTGALTGGTGAAVGNVVSGIAKDQGLTAKQTNALNASASVFTRSMLAGATLEQAFQAAAMAGGMANAKSVVKGLKSEKTAGLDISDDFVANLDKETYDPDVASQVIKQFQLATQNPSADPGVDVAGPGGEGMAAISGMTPMLGISGETSGKLRSEVDDTGATVYKREITGTTKDGKDYTYIVTYDPLAKEGKQISYEVPGNIGQEGEAAPSQVVQTSSYSRPVFDTDATSTDATIVGTSFEPVGGSKAADVSGLGKTSVGDGSGAGVNIGSIGTGAGGTGTGVGTGTGTGTGSGSGDGSGGGTGTGTGVGSGTGTGTGAGPGTGPGTTTPTTTPATTTTAKPATTGGGMPAVATAAALTGYIPPALKESLIKTKITGGKFQDPTKHLKDIQEAQLATENNMIQNGIDPQLAAILSARAVQAVDQPQTPHFTYGQEDSIDSILGSADTGALDQAYADGGYVQPLTLAPGGLAAPLMAATGGLPSKHKGREDFRTSKHVAGEGDGHSDDIPAMLADGEFVFSADVVSALGNGSTKAGSDKLYKMVEEIRKRARSTSPDKLAPPALKSPLDYLKKR